MYRFPALALLVACSNPLNEVGSIDADTAVLADQGALAHLSAALGDPAATVESLFDEDLVFPTMPDPTNLFIAANASHAALPTGTGQTLSVLTFNTGLLKRRYLFFKVEVPHIEARRARMGDEVFGAGHDIVFLQEVWDPDDVELLTAAGVAAGYRVFDAEKKKFRKETGVLLAVRADLVGAGDVQEGVQYDAQWKSENFPGPNLKRGYVHWSFPLAGSEVQLHLFDTHLTPFYDEWLTRNLQVRELGQAIAALPEDDVVLVGGDFNAGWHYPRDTWFDSNGDDFPGWWRNTTMPALLAHYGGLQDLRNLVEVAPDVQRGADIPEGADESWLTTAYGDATFCDVADTYTATDCNSIYRESYAATEFPARMDLLWLGDPNGHVRARSQELAFVEPMDFGVDGTFELSDHYGQIVEIEIID